LIVLPGEAIPDGWEFRCEECAAKAMKASQPASESTVAQGAGVNVVALATYKCCKCGKYLGVSKDDGLGPGLSRRCDECVIEDMEEEGEDSDYDDSTNPPTELKLGPSPPETPPTPVEHAATRLSILFMNMVCKFEQIPKSELVERGKITSHFLTASLPILNELRDAPRVHVMLPPPPPHGAKNPSCGIPVKEWPWMNAA
jgi:hypothetical protein